MRLARPRFTVRRLIVVVGLAGLALGLYGWMARRAEALRVEAVNQALARKQLAVIDEAWARLEALSQIARIEINGGTIGPWGRRRLEALRKAAAGKAEIVAALEKYINDLERFQEIANARHSMSFVRSRTLEDHEVVFLRMEAEIWLNEEKAR
jgi:hypothetical protein